MRAFHEEGLAGHFGPLRTYQKIVRRYFWPDMRKQIYNFVQSCDVCQRRGKPAKYPEPLHPLPVGKPFDRLGIDLLGPLPETQSGNKHIVVATDYLTKWPEARAVPDATAETVATFLYEEVVTRHGAPKEILSDRGKSFVNKAIAHLCSKWSIQHVLASAYHPQTNGLVERYNKTLAKTLAKLIDRQPREWDEMVPAAVFAYRTSRQETTQQTPFYLMYGREAVYPIETMIPPYPTNGNSTDSADLVQRTMQVFGPLEEARRIARRRIKSDQE
jgi:hypothetical protein